LELLLLLLVSRESGVEVDQSQQEKNRQTTGRLLFEDHLEWMLMVVVAVVLVVAAVTAKRKMGVAQGKV
jgi:hypothetical protein